MQVENSMLKSTFLKKTKVNEINLQFVRNPLKQLKLSLSSHKHQRLLTNVNLK